MNRGPPRFACCCNHERARARISAHLQPRADCGKTPRVVHMRSRSGHAELGAARNSLGTPRILLGTS
eukprot:5576885-Alexandrium_andersonii.AAC.1